MYSELPLCQFGSSVFVPRSDASDPLDVDGRNPLRLLIYGIRLRRLPPSRTHKDTIMTSMRGEDTDVHLFYATAGDAVCSSPDGQHKDPSRSPVSSGVTERTQATACMKETEDAQTRSSSTADDETTNNPRRITAEEATGNRRRKNNEPDSSAARRARANGCFLGRLLIRYVSHCRNGGQSFEASRVNPTCTTQTRVFQNRRCF